MSRSKLEKKQLLQRLKKAEENRARLETHWKELLHSYLGRWVAVHNGNVVATNDDHSDLFEKLRKDHPNFQLYAVELITSGPHDLII